ncbi:MAG: OmpA family protein [Myxococcales bacterium]|nr:OmpA family protein [Myxococcales bacterium]
MPPPLPGTASAPVPDAPPAPPSASATTPAPDAPSASASAAEPEDPPPVPSAAPPVTGPRQKWAAVAADAPPLTPPAVGRVDPAERTALAEVERAYRPLYQSLGTLWDAAPFDCPLTKPACAPRWEAAGTKLDELERSLRGPLCGWPDSMPISAIQRSEAHLAFLRARHEALATDLATVASERDGMFFLRGHAQVCLSCIATQPRVLERVPFEEGKATLAPGALDVLRQVKAVLDQPAPLVAAAPLGMRVRGHADAAEPGDPAALARARAEAVRAALVSLGVPAARLRVLAIGTAVPIAGPRQADNRRVDFDWEP